MAADINFRSRRLNVSAVPGDGFSFSVELKDLGFIAAPTAVATFGAVTATTEVAFTATTGDVTVVVTLSAAQTTTLSTTPVQWTLVVTPNGGDPRTFLSGDYVGDPDPIKTTPRAAHRIFPYDSVGTVTVTGGRTNEYILNGSGQFTPGGTDVPIADGGTGASTDSAARVSLKAQRSHVIALADYVAGDGVTDDTVALQAAITAAAGGRLVGGPSLSCLVSSFILPLSDTEFDGQGMQITSNSASVSLFIIAGKTNVTLRNLRLVGTAAYAVAITGSSTHIRVTDVSASGFARPFGANGVAATMRDIWFTRCLATGNPSIWGFEIRDCHDVTLTACVAEGCASDGFKINQKTFRVTLRDCVSRNNSEDGIDCYGGGDELTIAGFRAYGNTGNGIYIKMDANNRDDPSTTGYVRRISVSDAQCHDNGSVGLAIWEANFAGDASIPLVHMITVLGGVYSGNGYGIVANGRGISLLGPVVSSNTKDGIYLQSRCLDVEVSSAQVWNNGTSAAGTYDGIRCEGTRCSVIGGHSIGVDDPSALNDAALAGLTPTQRYGVYIHANAVDCRVVGVAAKHNVTNYVDSGADTQWPNGPRGAGSAPTLLCTSDAKYWSYPATHTTVVGVSGVLYVHPVFVPKDTTIDRIGAEVTAGSAGSTLTMVIYADAGNGTPGALVYSAGSTIDGNTVAAAEVTCSVALVGGRIYWLGILLLGGTPTLRAASSATSWRGDQSSLANALGAGAGRAGRNRTGLSSVPDPAGTTTASGTPPLIAVRTT